MLSKLGLAGADLDCKVVLCVLKETCFVEDTFVGLAVNTEGRLTNASSCVAWGEEVFVDFTVALKTHSEVVKMNSSVLVFTRLSPPICSLSLASLSQPPWQPLSP